jgi:hypothetical protein
MGLDLVAGVALGLYGRLGEANGLVVFALTVAAAIVLSISAWFVTPLPEWWDSFTTREKLGKLPGALIVDATIRVLRIGVVALVIYAVTALFTQ